MNIIFKYIRGFFILILFYFASLFITKLTNLPIPPAITGLVLFAAALIYGIIKEEWISDSCNFLIKNMALFIVPFMAGLVVYKSLLIKNWLVILTVIFITTTLTIILTGIFTEYGLKGGKHD